MTAPAQQPLMCSGNRGRVALVLVHAVLIQVIVFAMRPMLSYAALDLDASPAFLGVLSAAFAVPALLLALPAGHAVDRIGERAAMTTGASAVIAAAAIAVFGSAQISFLLLATVLLGAGHLFSVIGEQSVVGSAAGRGRSDSMFGYYAFAAAVGQTVGPLLLALPGGTRTTPPAQLVFLVCGGCAAALLALSLLIRRSPAPAGHEPSRMLRTAGTVLGTPGLPRALVASSMVLASVDIFVAYAPLVGHDRHLSAVVISGLLIARSAAAMVSRLLLGRLSTLLGRRSLLVWSVLLSAISLGCLAIPLPVPWLIALAGGYGFVVGICQPITMSWISVLAPPGTRGLAMSLRLAANRLGQTVIPATLGTLAAATGSAGVLLASGGMLLIATWSGAAVGANEEPADQPVPPGGDVAG